MQTKTIIPIAGGVLLGLVFGILVGYGIGFNADTGHLGSDDGLRDGQGMNGPLGKNQPGMSHEEMGHTGMEVTDEKTFLANMIPHHQEAIDASFDLLNKNPSPELRALAESIIATQTDEINTMTNWHLEWYNEPYQKNGSYTPMMRDTSTISAINTVEKMYLEDMILHHMGAVLMVESIKDKIEKPELQDLSTKIVSAQMIEMEQMNQILDKMAQ